MKYSIELTRNNGQQESLEKYKNKVLLIVNTASKCGFTNQYEGLEKLYQNYKERGFEVLGFPCNQFGSQEPGSDEDIKEFCRINYGVSFPLFQKIDVNGQDTHALYKQLKVEAKGLLDTEAIKWNFTKFLVSKDGSEVFRFAPNDAPESLAGKIEELL